MADYSVTAPATITIDHADGTTVIEVGLPEATTPPVTPPAGQQQTYVAKAGSGDWIIRSDGVRLDINSPGTIFYGGGAIPDSTGSYAVGYDPSSNATYKQSAADAPWLYWGGSMTTSDWHTPATPWTPPTGVPPTTGDLRSRILAYVAGLNGKLLVGQYVDSATAGYADLDAFTAATGKHVAVVGDGLWPAWPNTYSAAQAIPKVIPAMIEQWKRGALVYMNSFYPCPAGGDMYASCTPSEVIRPGSAQYNKLFQFYDQEIVGFKQLEAAGVVIINRAFLESRWNFWWGATNSGVKFTDQQFRTMVVQRDDYYKSKGLNLIRVHSQGFNQGDGSGRDNYPGDDRLEWQGEDCYSDTLAPYKSWYDNEIAKHPGKEWILAEWGSGNPSKGNSAFDMRSLFAGLKSGMPRARLFQAWCGSWRLAAMQHLVEAMADPAALTLENMNRPT